MPVDKSAPLGLGALFGQLDAVAIVANVGTPKKWRSTFRRCGIRLGDSTNAHQEVLCALEWVQLAL
ncbi:hypothetical protein CABS03_09368 [Colletotrichum abscissum]|uniref:Uncharacterized protein n=1 Tax=Colletotrichum abscissum TaxID=1671311 RepID=A0A9P9XHC7_9PEZI|nr:hypothetical protein CABS02_05921 [Colletotrichum abscissum]